MNCERCKSSFPARDVGVSPNWFNCKNKKCSDKAKMLVISEPFEKKFTKFYIESLDSYPPCSVIEEVFTKTGSKECEFFELDA